MKTKWNLGAIITAIASLGLPGCGTARDVAVTSFRVIDAPANYVRRHLEDEPPSRTTTTTTTTYRSDSVNPGRPLPPGPPPPPPRNVSERTSSPSRESVETRETVRSTPSPRRPAATASIPYAKPVPGKPGFVYSLDPNGGYVDVTGIASGTKMKDPYTQKIFIVP